jgi:hypothetical protein
MKKTTFGPNLWLYFIIISAILLLVSNLTPAKDKPDNSMKSTFLIKLPHTQEECLANLDKIEKEDPAILDKIEWGCKTGDHTGYLIIDAKDKDEALSMLPEFERKEAQVEKVDKFTVEDIEKIHSSK